jgi:hypothetical protein
VIKAPKNKPFYRKMWMSSGVSLLGIALFFQMGAVSLTHQSCFTSGKERVHFGQKKQCCTPETTTTASFQAQCCEINQHSAIFHNFLPKDEVRVLLTHVDLNYSLALKPQVIAVDFLRQWVRIHQKIPQRSGPDLLALFCVYLI